MLWIWPVLALFAAAAVFVRLLGGKANDGGKSEYPYAYFNDFLREVDGRMHELASLASGLDADLAGRIAEINGISTEIMRSPAGKPDFISGLRMFMDYHYRLLIDSTSEYIARRETEETPEAAAQAEREYAALLADAEAVFARQLEAVGNGSIMDMEAELPNE